MRHNLNQMVSYWVGSFKITKTLHKLIDLQLSKSKCSGYFNLNVEYLKQILIRAFYHKNFLWPNAYGKIRSNFRKEKRAQRKNYITKTNILTSIWLTVHPRDLVFMLKRRDVAEKLRTYNYDSEQRRFLGNLTKQFSNQQALSVVNCIEKKPFWWPLTRSCLNQMKPSALLKRSQGETSPRNILKGPYATSVLCGRAVL